MKKQLLLFTLTLGLLGNVAGAMAQDEKYKKESSADEINFQCYSPEEDEYAPTLSEQYEHTHATMMENYRRNYLRLQPSLNSSYNPIPSTSSSSSSSSSSLHEGNALPKKTKRSEKPLINLMNPAQNIKRMDGKNFLTALKTVEEKLTDYQNFLLGHRRMELTAQMLEMKVYIQEEMNDTHEQDHHAEPMKVITQALLILQKALTGYHDYIQEIIFENNSLKLTPEEQDLYFAQRKEEAASLENNVLKSLSEAFNAQD